MKRKLIILLFFLTTILIFSCKKSRDEPEPTQGHLEGHVFSLNSDEKISVVSNAEIDINNRSLKSDELGRFKIEFVNEGSYELKVTHPKHFTKSENLKIIAGETVNADIILTPSPSFLIIGSEDFSDSLTLDFDSTKTELTLTIKNGGGENLLWGIEEDADWLSVNDFAGTNESIIKVKVNRDELNSFEDSTNIVITNTSTNNEFIIKAKVKIDIKSQLKKGLLAYYPFNGNTNDESGNEYHGVNNGAELTTDRNGINNSAYFLDGTDIIDIPNHIEFNFLNEFSISLWVKLDSSKSWHTFILKRNPVNDIVFHSFSNRLMAGFHTNSGQENFQGRPLKQKEWIFITMIWRNDNKVFLYENSVVSGINQMPFGLDWVGTELMLGGFINHQQNGNYEHSLIGKIDEVRFYKRALLEDEIKYLYEN